MMKSSKNLISICKKCNYIKGYTVSNDTWKALKSGKDKPVISVPYIAGSGNIPSITSHTYTVTTSGTYAYYDGTSSQAHPLQCTDCGGKCKICLQHKGTAGFMSKCGECKHKFLCATNRVEWEEYGDTITFTTSGNSITTTTNHTLKQEFVKEKGLKNGSKGKTTRVGQVLLGNIKSRFRKKQVPVKENRSGFNSR